MTARGSFDPAPHLAQLRVQAAELAGQQRPKRKRPQPGQEAEELRQATREAHEAAQELRDAEKLWRQLLKEVSEELVEEIIRIVNDSIDKLDTHLADQQSSYSKSLAAHVSETQLRIVRALMISRLVPDNDLGGLRIEFGLTAEDIVKLEPADAVVRIRREREDGTWTEG